ncbi:MAG: alpha/beta fold hydrolase [Candidatus Binataceae bacterium]
MSVFSEVASYWMEGALRTLEAAADGFATADPEPVTPYSVVYEGGKASLRHYRPAVRRHATPLLVVYALIKRPFILDLQPGKSVVEVLLAHGFEVYLIDWIPPSFNDAGRGFDTYVNQDLANAVRAVQIAEQTEHVNLLGYCFGGLLSLLYTALHQENVRNLVTLATPFDMGVRELPFYHLFDGMLDSSIELMTTLYGNCPAWAINGMFTAMSPVHHAFDKYVGLYRNAGRDGYAGMFELFERWMRSDVPLTGRIFRELTLELFKRNALVKGGFKLGNRTVELSRLTCPLLNVVAELDDVVHPSSSLALSEFVGSADKRNLTFPTGHIGAVVSSAAISRLWPQVANWLAERSVSFN